MKISDHIFNNWGQPIGLHLMAPSKKDDKTAQVQWAAFLRRSASPGTAKTFYEMNIGIDVRSGLQNIDCPVLIMHREGDRLIDCAHSKYLHSQLPNS